MLTFWIQFPLVLGAILLGIRRGGVALGMILFVSNVKAADVARSSVFTAGMIAVVSIFGIAWMSDTFVSGNGAYLVSKIKSMVAFAPWTFALAMFAVSAFVKSQAATLTIMMPFGLALGLPTTLLLGLLP